MLMNGTRHYTLCKCADNCGQPTGFFTTTPAGSKLLPRFQGMITGHRPKERSLIQPDEIAAARRAEVLLTAARAEGLIRRKLA